MRRLITSIFMSLDGIVQAPGGPEEDPTKGFAFGGWTFTFWDEVMAQSMVGFDGVNRELVLGRKTYEIFEAHWPYQPANDPTALSLNAVRKHVASRTLKAPGWNNSTVLGDDVVAAVRVLKSQDGPDLQTIGSGKLIQTLHAASLIDEYNVWIFPVVLGAGKRLFEVSAKPVALRLLESRMSTSGVLLTKYIPAGSVPTGSFAQIAPSSKELARRAKMLSEP